MSNRVYTLMVLFLNNYFSPSIHAHELTGHCSTAFNEVVAHYFKEASLEEISVSPIPGGHSNIALLISYRDRRYVLSS